MDERLPDETEQEYSERMHRENDPHYFTEEEILGIDEDEDEMQMECPYRDGEGFQSDGKIGYDCPECGGTGWC